MDSKFRTLLIAECPKSPLDYNLLFDVVLIELSALPAYYMLRTLRQIYNYEELSMLKYEWVPIIIAGTAFLLWVVEGSYFDITGNFTVQSHGIQDATIFLSVSIFAVAAARFSETWGGYVKKVELMKEMQREAAAEGLVGAPSPSVALGDEARTARFSGPVENVVAERGIRQESK